MLFLSSSSIVLMVLMVERSDGDTFALLLNVLFLLSPEKKDMEAIFLVRNVMVLLKLSFTGSANCVLLHLSSRSVSTI